MLQRFALGAAAGEVAQFGEIRLRERLVEAEVQVQAAAAEYVSQQMLHVQPRLIDAALFQIAGAGAESFKEELHSGGLEG